MKRLYFLVPNLDLAKTVAGELRQMGVKDDHIHVVANFRTPLDGFHQATFLQTSDFRHGLFMGILLGGLAGLLGGLLAVYAAPGKLQLAAGTIIVMSIAGAILGALVSGMVAKDVPSPEVEPYQDEIIKGRLLLIVDVARKQVDSAKELILEHHPDAAISVKVSPHSV